MMRLLTLCFAACLCAIPLTAAPVCVAAPIPAAPAPESAPVPTGPVPESAPATESTAAPESAPASETASPSAPETAPAPASAEPAPSDEAADEAAAPKFRDGDLFAFKGWVLERLKLPAGAPANVRGGIVTVRFKVTAAGKARDVEVRDLAGTTFDRQIRRLVASSTGWTPAVVGGIPVEMTCEMALKFAFLPDPATGVMRAEDIEVYDRVDTEPLFDAGNAEELSQYLHARIVAAHPDTDTVPARAAVRFIVEKDGTFTEPGIRIQTDGDRKLLKERIMEVLQNLPAAAPGRIRDTPVRTQCWLSFEFGDPEAVAAKFGDADEPLPIAETMPSFRNGDLMTFRRWVQANLRYPAELSKEGIEGRVMVSFVIERDGTLSDIRILQSPDTRLSKVVVAVLSASPRWSPGVQYGKKVRVRYMLPLDFHL